MNEVVVRILRPVRRRRAPISGTAGAISGVDERDEILLSATDLVPVERLIPAHRLAAR